MTTIRTVLQRPVEELQDLLLQLEGAMAREADVGLYAIPRWERVCGIADDIERAARALAGGAEERVMACQYQDGETSC